MKEELGFRLFFLLGRNYSDFRLEGKCVCLPRIWLRREDFGKLSSICTVNTKDNEAPILVLSNLTNEFDRCEQ